MATATAPRPDPVVWESHRVYTRAETVRFWGISPATLWQWQKDGLPILCAGAKEYRYFGQDVIDFIRSKTPVARKPRGAAKRGGK